MTRGWCTFSLPEPAPFPFAQRSKVLGSFASQRSDAGNQIPGRKPLSSALSYYEVTTFNAAVAAAVLVGWMARAAAATKRAASTLFRRNALLTMID